MKKEVRQKSPKRSAFDFFRKDGHSTCLRADISTDVNGAGMSLTDGKTFYERGHKGSCEGIAGMVSFTLTLGVSMKEVPPSGQSAVSGVKI